MKVAVPAAFLALEVGVYWLTDAFSTTAILEVYRIKRALKLENSAG